MRHFAPIRGSILPLVLRRQPPFHFFWSSHSLGYPTPGLVSTLLNQAYSTPSRLVQTFLQVTEQVWHPMHLSRFSTIAICARIFILQPPFSERRSATRADRMPACPASRLSTSCARSQIHRGWCRSSRNN